MSETGHECKYSYCSLPEVAERVFDADVSANRIALIRRTEKKWVNGTVLHYYFFDEETDGEDVYFTDGTTEWRTWTTTGAEKEVVRRGFGVWEEVGIGAQFQEVSSRDDAEIRIGFMRDDGAWSFVGRDILDCGRDERTMNFGWDLTRHESEIDTAVHEIGHTLGFPHEHQNPNAGIAWDEEAVYAALAREPNRWPRQKTHYNIIRKIDPDTVQGSSWDPDSIMHYAFGPGLIDQPEEYRDGLDPAPGLSNRDEAWARAFYPPLTATDYTELRPLESQKLAVLPGGQHNFTIKPAATRYYEISTFGTSDTVMVLFKDEDGEPRYVTADDDSGESYNAHLRVKLFTGRQYILRVRLYYSERSGETAVMMW